MIITPSVKNLNLFTGAIIYTTSQKYKMKRNLEVNQPKLSVSCSVFIGPSRNRKRHRKR